MQLVSRPPEYANTTFSIIIPFQAAFLLKVWQITDLFLIISDDHLHYQSVNFIYIHMILGGYQNDL